MVLAYVIESLSHHTSSSQIVTRARCQINCLLCYFNVSSQMNIVKSLRLHCLILLLVLAGCWGLSCFLYFFVPECKLLCLCHGKDRVLLFDHIYARVGLVRTMDSCVGVSIENLYVWLNVTSALVLVKSVWNNSSSCFVNQLFRANCCVKVIVGSRWNFLAQLTQP